MQTLRSAGNYLKHRYRTFVIDRELSTVKSLSPAAAADIYWKLMQHLRAALPNRSSARRSSVSRGGGALTRFVDRHAQQAYEDYDEKLDEVRDHVFDSTTMTYTQIMGAVVAQRRFYQLNLFLASHPSYRTLDAAVRKLWRDDEMLLFLFESTADRDALRVMTPKQQQHVRAATLAWARAVVDRDRSRALYDVGSDAYGLILSDRLVDREARDLRTVANATSAAEVIKIRHKMKDAAKDDAEYFRHACSNSNLRNEALCGLRNDMDLKPNEVVKTHRSFLAGAIDMVAITQARLFLLYGEKRRELDVYEWQQNLTYDLATLRKAFVHSLKISILPLSKVSKVCFVPVVFWKKRVPCFLLALDNGGPAVFSGKLDKRDALKGWTTADTAAANVFDCCYQQLGMCLTSAGNVTVSPEQDAVYFFINLQHVPMDYLRHDLRRKMAETPHAKFRKIEDVFLLDATLLSTVVGMELLLMGRGEFETLKKFDGFTKRAVDARALPWVRADNTRILVGDVKQRKRRRQ
jgi:hypothetical protein